MNKLTAVKLAEARQHLLKLSRQSVRGARFALTSHGRPEAVLLAPEDYYRLRYPDDDGYGAVILAGTGGKPSRRAGRAKAVATLSRKLHRAGVRRQAVVLDRPNDKELAALAELDLAVVQTGNRNEGFASSLKRGLRFIAPGTPAALILFATMPRVSERTLAALVRRHKCGSGSAIVLPVHGGRRGHPVLLDQEMYTAVLRMDPRWGLSPLMRKYAAAITELPVKDAAVVRTEKKQG